MSDNYTENWPKEFKKYVKKERVKTEAIRKNMIKSGWKHVCIEPNIMSLEEWKKETNYEQE